MDGTATVPWVLECRKRGHGVWLLAIDFWGVVLNSVPQDPFPGRRIWMFREAHTTIREHGSVLPTGHQVKIRDKSSGEGSIP